MPDDNEFEHHKILIAAAVTALLGKNASVRRIRAVNHPVTSDWARQGRISVQRSHNLDVQHWEIPPRGTE